MKMKKYNLAFRTYEDRILGAWLGKSIGGTVGAAFEGHKEFKHLKLDDLWPEQLPPNDDMDIQIVWLEMLQEIGCFPTSADLIHFWQDRCWYNFCEYGTFLRNVQHGIMPPLSGSWNNDFFQESEGCPIRSDIWGLVCPGNLELAAALAGMDGELDHSGFSVEAEMFYAAMTAAALVEDDFAVILQAAQAVLPSGSQIPAILENVKKIAANIPDGQSAWRVTIRNFGNRDASKAITNFALVFLAFFKSGGNFAEAMRLCCNFGWDVDCTSATLGAFLGAWQGTKCIPNGWRSRLGQNLVCGIEVKHKNATIEALARDTAMVGVEMARCRNRRIQLTDAPTLVPRPQLPSEPHLSVEYPSAPVLYAEKATAVKLSVKNFTGKIMITSAPGTLCEPAVIENGGTCLIRRCSPDAPLPEKNIFAVNLNGVPKTFGLEGARQWRIYGPYWDMWKREKYGDVCAYASPDIIAIRGKRSIPSTVFKLIFLPISRIWMSPVWGKRKFRKKCRMTSNAGAIRWNKKILAAGSVRHVGILPGNLSFRKAIKWQSDSA